MIVLTFGISTPFSMTVVAINKSAYRKGKMNERKREREEEGVREREREGESERE